MKLRKLACIYLACILVLTTLSSVSSHPAFENIQSEEPSTPSLGRALVTALREVTQAVNHLSNRVTALEVNVQIKFSRLEENTKDERYSLSGMSNRLGLLESLSRQAIHLEQKLREETTVIKNAIEATNRDVRLLAYGSSTLRPSLPSAHFGKYQRKPIESNLKDGRERENQGLKHEGKDDDDMTQRDVKEIYNLIIKKIDEIVPSLSSTEMAFYTSIVDKIDRNFLQIQRESTLRQRHLQDLTERVLVETQEGRQDISHVLHLQRALADNVTAAALAADKKYFKSCHSGNQNNIDSLLTQLSESMFVMLNKGFNSFTSNVTSKCNSNTSSKPFAGPSSSSRLSWQSLFQTQPSLTGSASSTTRCPDVATYSALQEVKVLLRTLLNKSEDLRRVLSKQTSEGVELLKDLHLRFSVLIRRMNVEPQHGEALIAEVQELEHLVQSSYSSILHAQNVFIETCHRIQNEEPNLEGKIGEVLSKLVTNIDLGHKFNQKQLAELRQLIEKIGLGRSSLSLVSKHDWQKGLAKRLEAASQKANQTEAKLRLVSGRIEDVERELSFQDVSSTVTTKDTVDRLLTAVKDLKGISRGEIAVLKTLQDNLLEFISEYTTNSNSLNESNQPLSSMKNKTQPILRLPKSCTDSLLKQLRFLYQQKVEQKYNNTHKVDKNTTDKYQEAGNQFSNEEFLNDEPPESQDLFRHIDYRTLLRVIQLDDFIEGYNDVNNDYNYPQDEVLDYNHNLNSVTAENFHESQKHDATHLEESETIMEE